MVTSLPTDQKAPDLIPGSAIEVFSSGELFLISMDYTLFTPKVIHKESIMHPSASNGITLFGTCGNALHSLDTAFA